MFREQPPRLKSSPTQFSSAIKMQGHWEKDGEGQLPLLPTELQNKGPGKIKLSESMWLCMEYLYTSGSNVQRICQYCVILLLYLLASKYKSCTYLLPNKFIWIQRSVNLRKKKKPILLQKFLSSWYFVKHLPVVDYAFTTLTLKNKCRHIIVMMAECPSAVNRSNKQNVDLWLLI